VVAEEHTVLASEPRARWWRFVFPGPIELKRAIIRRWFQQARKRIVREQDSYSLLWDRQARLTEIRRFLAEYEFGLQSFQEHLDCLAEKLKGIRRAGECLEVDAIEEALTTRDRLIRELGEKVAVTRDSVAETIACWSARLRRSQKSLRKEAEPLGVKLPC
jgi:hypothetical protein